MQQVDLYQNIPNELKNRNQWVCYKIIPRGKSGKFAKLPKSPHTGGDAKSNDTSTWSDFQTAVQAVKKYNFDGIGIQFADGIFGVDLDGVVKDGKFSRVAEDIISTMDSYTEYSPSGEGVHILCKGTIPPKDRRNGNVEMYSEGRFFTVTGNLIGSQKLLHERTAQAKEVHSKYISRDIKTKEAQATLPLSDKLSDA